MESNRRSPPGERWLDDPRIIGFSEFRFFLASATVIVEKEIPRRSVEADGSDRRPAGSESHMLPDGGGIRERVAVFH
jgi:hypothetical protein